MENKACPYCKEDMDYRPQTHWTGKRFVTIQHEWICTKRDHTFKLREFVGDTK